MIWLFSVVIISHPHDIETSLSLPRLKFYCYFFYNNKALNFFFILFFFFEYRNRIYQKKKLKLCEREREREQWGLVLRNQKVALKVESNCRRREGTAGNEEEVQNATFRSMTIFSLRTTLIDLTSTLPSKSKVVILIHSFIHSFKYWFIELINIYCDENQEA